jgi:hypothetical protein
VVNSWKVGDPATFIFSSRKTGVFTLSVQEIDEMPQLFSNSTSFSVKQGFNYIITVTLGGNITTIVSPAE